MSDTEDGNYEGRVSISVERYQIASFLLSSPVWLPIRNTAREDTSNISYVRLDQAIHSYNT